MFDFAHPIYLLALLALPVLFGLYMLDRYRRRRALRQFGQPSVLAPLMPDASRYMPMVKLCICLLAFAAVVFILARPRAGKPVPQQSRVQGIEIMIAFDVSNSMLASATDNPEGISRLDQARLLLDKLVDKLSNDKVGLEVFAADAKVLMPLTTDYYTAKMYLNELSPAMVPYQGTNLSDAIAKAQGAFSANDSIHKAIILITDAESHDGDAVAAAAAALQKGIQVNVVGVGTSKGMPIPMGSNGDYLTDNEEKIVLTAFDDAAAKKIAEAGKGVYVNGSSARALDDLVGSLDNLDKSEFQTKRYTSRDEQFPTFAWLALVLLVAESFLVDRKIGWLKRINFFTNRMGPRKAGAGALALLLAFALTGCKGDGSTKAERLSIAEGNEQFADGDYTSALDNYQRALIERSESEPARFNQAAAKYNLALSNPADTLYGVQSMQEYKALGDSATDISVRERAYYNRANIAFWQGRAADELNPGQKAGVQYYKESVEFYKRALKINPSNMHARENLLVALLQIPPEDQDNQDQNQDQQQQQQQQQQQEQQQQEQQLNQNTEQLLEAMQNKENDTRRRAQPQGGQRYSDKPW